MTATRSIIHVCSVLALSVLPLMAIAQNKQKHHNKIDDIKGIALVEKLLRSVDSDYVYFKINKQLKYSDKGCQSLCNNAKPQPYIKADLDNNGYTDILMMCEDNDIICILDSGNNHFFINRLTHRIHEDCLFPLVSMPNNENGTSIVLTGFKEYDRYDTSTRTRRIIEQKKLVYKFGDFIEYNAIPESNKIEKIEFTTTPCFGSCPVFSITIYADRTASYNAIEYNHPDGKFKGTIRQANYDELVDLLNYIRFPSLKDNYAVGWTDDQACTLTITYNNGEVKKIHDYGLVGTYGLSRIYHMLFQLRTNQKWK